MVSFGLLFLRLVVGGIFALHGYPKLFGGEGKSEGIHPKVKGFMGEGFSQHMENGGLQKTTGMMESLNLPAPALAAVAVSAVEFGGGIALMLGWHARLAALTIMFSQLVAVDKIHFKNGMMAQGGFEHNAALIAATGALALTGPGAIALD